MTDKDSGMFVITLKNGHSFQHIPYAEPTPENVELYNRVYDMFQRGTKGVLKLNNPITLYRVEDISSMKFPELKDVADTPSIGFHIPND